MFRTDHPSSIPLNPSTAYILGFFAADGNITVNKNGSHYIEFTSKDRVLIDAVREGLGVANRVGIRRGDGAESERYRLQIGSRSWAEQLTALGFGPRKSRVLSFPNLPENLLADFIRGYFDGDGNVLFKLYSKPNGTSYPFFRVVFTSCSRGFLEDLRIKLLDLAGAQGNIRSEGTYFRLIYWADEIWRLHNLMYNSAEANRAFCLERKKKIFERAAEYYRGRGVAWLTRRRNARHGRKLGGESPLWALAMGTTSGRQRRIARYRPKEAESKLLA
jgi:intein-encoded DNA endonuclease-like protein